MKNEMLKISKILVLVGVIGFIAACAKDDDDPAPVDPIPMNTILMGIEESVVTGAGWTECWSETYATTGTTIASIMSACTGANLMMACRPMGNTAFSLAAWGDKTIIMTDTGAADNDITTDAGSVSWYYSGDHSWGFAPVGEGVDKNSCDFDTALPSQDKRLCWHTGGGAIDGGYRCGANDLNGDSTWQRVLLHK